jgi:MscS family membrane protein
MESIKEFFQTVLNNPYFKFLLILAVSFVIAFLMKFIMKRVLAPLAKRTETKIDDLLIKSVSSIIFWIVLVIGLKQGLSQLRYGTDPSGNVIDRFKTNTYDNLVSTILILIICIVIIRIITNFSKHWLKGWAAKTESTADDRLIPLVTKILKVVVIILALMFIFEAWKINISPLLATAGIAGIAISFAVKDSLTNMLGGLQLVLDKTFKVGDKVELQSGELGVILDIGLRSTKMKTYDNEIIYIPNGYLANSMIKNYTMPDLSVRVNVPFGVEYGSDVDKVIKVVLDAVKKIDIVLEDPAPVIHFVKMSDFSLDFIARAWVKEYGDAYNLKIQMVDTIYNALNQANIGIPFPTRTIYTKVEK